jgi:plastocyanin domain-containing protein
MALSTLALAGCKSEPSGSEPAAASTTAGEQRVAIKAVQGGFEPAEVHLTQGMPATLEFTRVVDSECVNAVLMPWLNEAVDLPEGEPVTIAVDTSKAGTFTYSCWMKMVFGKVVIDPAE